MQGNLTVVTATGVTAIPLNAVTPVPADNPLRQLLWGYRASLQYQHMAQNRIPEFYRVVKEPIPCTGVYLSATAEENGKAVLGTLSTEIAFKSDKTLHGYQLEVLGRQLVVFSEQNDETAYALGASDRLTLSYAQGSAPPVMEKTWFPGVNTNMWLSDRRVSTYCAERPAIGAFLSNSVEWGLGAGRAIVFAHVGNCPATMTPQYELASAIGTQALWQPDRDISSLQLPASFNGWQPTCTDDKRYVGRIIEIVRQLVTTTLQQPIVVYLTGLDDLIYPDESSVEGLAAILRTAPAEHIGVIVETDSERMRMLLETPVEDHREEAELVAEDLQELQDEIDMLEAGDYL